MVRTLILIGLLVSVVDLRIAGAQELTDAQKHTLLSEAQNSYDDGVQLRRDRPDQSREAFHLAAARFQQLIDGGVVNGPLFYNLGNACLQSGELGRAIAAYLAADELMPGDPRLESNLRYARSLRTDQFAPPTQTALVHSLLFWHEDTTTGSRFTTFTIAWCAFWGLIMAHRFLPQRWMRWPALGLIVIWLAAGASVVFDLTVHEPPAGVITAEKTIVRKGGGEGFEPQFQQPIHEGTEFTVAEQRGGWWRIILPDGGEGWIPESSALQVTRAT